MFPLIAIAGVISAVATVAKGASWVSDHVGSTHASASSAAKTDAKPQTNAKVSPFEAALAAQAAGQTLPGGANAALAARGPTQPSMIPPAHGTDYDALARMKAGIAAYGNVGKHHGNHPGAANLSVPTTQP